MPRLMPIVTAIISAAAVALHQIKRREGSGISGLFAILERAITEISFEVADCSVASRLRYFLRSFAMLAAMRGRVVIPPATDGARVSAVELLA